MLFECLVCVPRSKNVGSSLNLLTLKLCMRIPGLHHASSLVRCLHAVVHVSLSQSRVLPPHGPMMQVAKEEYAGSLANASVLRTGFKSD